MDLIDNTKEDWGLLLKKNPMLFIKYVGKSDCEESEKVSKLLKAISGEKKYSEVKFVRMSPDNNPVAERHIKKNKAFVAAFKDGLLIECASVTSEKELRQILDNLQSYKFKQ